MSTKTFPPEETKNAKTLGPFSGRHTPDYKIRFYREGHPNKPINIDETSVVHINTKKNINSEAGQFKITLKDGRAFGAIAPMDVVRIRLKGHTQPLSEVFTGVVDEVSPEGSANMQGGEESVVIEGRCCAKYLQINTLFLPVWNPKSSLPTVLTFGATIPSSDGKKYSTPREVFGYIYRNFVLGQGKEVGISGTPNARFWLKLAQKGHSRFEKIKNAKGEQFKVPYIQFEENSTMEALEQLTVTGFSEAWVDELGWIVFRRPGWDQPAAWILDGGDMSAWAPPETDVGLSTYVEVSPTGALQSIPTAEAVLAGRAPVPSSYVDSYNSLAGSEGGFQASPEFVIDTDREGHPTKKGERNPYYKYMRKYGMRPLQINSPLLMTHQEAQEQAEGLLRFMLRWQKTGTITIAGEPQVRLGTNILIQGTLRGRRIERAFYIEGVEQDYVEENEGGHYQTALELGHGRDPTDPHFPPIQLSNVPAGIIQTQLKASEEAEGTNKNTSYESAANEPLPGSSTAILNSQGEAMIPGEAPTAVQNMVKAGNEIRTKPYVYGGGHGQSLEGPAESYDCSSSVDYLLFHGGFIGNETPTSGQLESMFDAGVGQWVTIYANPSHVFMKVAGLIWDHGNGAWFGSLEAAGQSTEGFQTRHPKGY